MLIAVLMYASETMMWKENQRSSNRAVQMENLKRFAGFQENGLSPKSTDKGEERGEQKD